MFSRNDIKAFALLPKTITQLAEDLGISTTAAFKITEKLVQDRLAQKHRQGKTVLVSKERTIQAQDLDTILQTFPRIPLYDILSHSSLPFLALMDYPLHISEIAQILGITRQWTYQLIEQNTNYGIILKEKKGYHINQHHGNIHQFATHYYMHRNNELLQSLVDDGQILWQHGPEFLFKTKQDLNNLKRTAVSAFSDYGLPLISEMKYYFYSKRTLEISDFILQSILIQPQSRTYNAYACLLYEKTKPEDILKKARIYNLTIHAQNLLDFLEKKQTKENLPSINDYQTLAEEYGVR